MRENDETLDPHCQICNVQVKAHVVGVYSALALGEYAMNDSTPVNLNVYQLSICNHCDSPFLTCQLSLELPGGFSTPRRARCKPA